MKIYFPTLVRSTLGLGAVGALMVLGEATARPGQVARADDWQWYISNVGEYCEGCCSIQGSFCCRFSDACRRTPIRPSTDG
jgi:hypothetical protein